MPAPVDQKLARKYYNRCNPRESLAPDDQRNVDVDAAFTEARGSKWVEFLANRIELSTEPACELFTGLPGSGKSTELLRLAARLQDPERANLLAVLIDAEEVIDLRSTIDVTDILMAILFKAEARVLEAEKKNPRNALRDSLLHRFVNWLTNTEPELKIDATIPGVGAKLIMDLKTRPTLRKRIRHTLADHVSTFIAQVSGAIAELDRRARARGHAGLVVIFDSLEKVRGTTENWKDVLASAERVFSDRAADLRLPVHVLYTLPTALVQRMNVPVTFLPMLKLADRDGERAAGFDVAREIVRRRVPDSALDEFFGAQNREARVTRLIEWSGGYPREIVRLLQDCIAAPVLDEAGFTRLLSLAGDEYCRTVPEVAHPWLARVHVEKGLPIVQEDQREMVDHLLQNNVVLRYLNDIPWFDLHPAVRTIPGVTAAIERLRHASTAPVASVRAGAPVSERGSAARTATLPASEGGPAAKPPSSVPRPPATQETLG